MSVYSYRRRNKSRGNSLYKGLVCAVGGRGPSNAQTIPSPLRHHVHNTSLPMQEPKEMRVPSLGQEDPLEKGMATHSSILAWRIPWTEEPGGLQSLESQSEVTSMYV